MATAVEIIQHCLAGEAVSLSEVRTSRFEFLTNPDIIPQQFFTEEELAHDVAGLVNLFGYGATGKTSFAREFHKKHHRQVARCPEDMTRPLRDAYGEVDGEDLYAIDEAEFYRRLERGEYLVAYRVIGEERPEKFAGVRTEVIRSIIQSRKRAITIVNLPAYCVLLKIFPAARPVLVYPSDEEAEHLFLQMRNMSADDRAEMGPWGQIPMPDDFAPPGLVRLPNEPYLLASASDQLVKQGWRPSVGEDAQPFSHILAMSPTSRWVGEIDGLLREGGVP